jgi:hypothetical protein
MHVPPRHRSRLLIVACYFMCAGDWKRAEDHFRYVHDRAAKGAASKRKYYFASLVGMVRALYRPVSYRASALERAARD